MLSERSEAMASLLESLLKHLLLDLYPAWGHRMLGVIESLHDDQSNVYQELDETYNTVTVLKCIQLF